MTRAKPKFGWLEAAAERLAASPAYRRLGSVDMTVAFVAGDVARLVAFDAFGVGGVRDLTLADLRDADLVIRMSGREWDTYLRARRRGTGQSLLSLDLDRRIVTARNPLLRLKFERFSASLQAFVDEGARSAA